MAKIWEPEDGSKRSARSPEENLQEQTECAGRQNRDRALRELREQPCEENLWKCVVAFCGFTFRTVTGLPFTYTLKIGRNGKLTRELWIDRREGSKSLAWSSVLLAYRGIKEFGAVVERPKALGDIRGVSYIYGIFYYFGLLDVPEGKRKKEHISHRVHYNDGFCPSLQEKTEKKVIDRRAST